jgi:hypothetical protein
LAKNPDLLDVGTGGTRDCGLMIKQARELGYKGPILAWALSKGQVEKIVPKESLENTITVTPPPLGAGLPMKGKTKELFDWYVSKFDVNEWDSAALSPHAMMELLTIAVKKAQSLDPYKLAAALRRSTRIIWWTLPTGRRASRPSGSDTSGHVVSLYHLPIYERAMERGEYGYAFD